MEIQRNTAALFSEPVPGTRSNRLMWINADRVFYASSLGAPTTRTLGAIALYISLGKPHRISINGGAWETTALAIVPPYVPHRIVGGERHICKLLIEAETVDIDRLPPFMAGRAGALEAPALVQRVRDTYHRLLREGRNVDLQGLNFDLSFFGEELPCRPIDRRILAVLNQIKNNPAAPLAAEECAESAHLSFSRFLHLFKQEVGAPFRSFRTWKRARNLLHYVTKDANLAYIALDTGYPDSTHFSHSIRQVYGLKPKDMFASSRQLALYGQAPASIFSYA